jgi:hypothetical protein
LKGKFRFGSEAGDGVVITEVIIRQGVSWGRVPIGALIDAGVAEPWKEGGRGAARVIARDAPAASMAVGSGENGEHFAVAL